MPSRRHNSAMPSRDYFSERARLSEWRTPRQLSIDDVAWKADLLAHQAKMAKLSSESSLSNWPHRRFKLVFVP